MKKVLIHTILILLAFILYFLQTNLFSWFTIAGIMPNLYVIYILFIGLFAGKIQGVIYGGAVGFFLDLVIGNTIGIYAISLGVIGFITGVLDKNFSKDSKMTIMFMVGTLTLILEILIYGANYIIHTTNIEILLFLIKLVIEVIYNLLITIILYPLMQKFGYYIENEYKGNKILTRYF